MIRDLLFAAASGAAPNGPESWTFSLSSVFSSYTGHTGTQTKTSGGLADGVFSGTSSVAATNAGASEFIQADFGGVKNVSKIKISPIPNSFDGWGPSYLNGRLLQKSTDGSTWTTIQTITGATDGVLMTINASVNARYVRIATASSGYIGVSEFSFE